ncbi:carbohydrate ABC transporter permease [Isoptericola sp. NPDC056578]|uniref:carbohydrate ABC transporter permease n=1 Tax=Isoptericola sp. NPDC056578 TaxID=3345870 RepID=UPI0036B231FA
MTRVAAPVRRPARSTRSRQDARAGAALVTPTVLVVAAVVVLPFLAVVVLAFQDIKLAQLPHLTLADLELDPENVVGLFTSAGFWTALRTTVVLSVATAVLSVAAGVAMALALRRPFPARAVVRALVLVPYVLPVVASMQTWRTLLNTQYGWVNAVGTSLLGWDEPVAFLTTPDTTVLGVTVPVALVSVIVVMVWHTFPLAYLFAAARLHAVSGDLEEAAALDGAGPWQRIRHVVLPELAGVVSILLLLRFIWTFQTFNEVYLLTGGAAGTEVLAVRVYNELVTRSDIGAASGVGVAITAILAVFIALYLVLQRRRETE